MSATDDPLRTLWRAIERAGDLEQELRTTAEEVAAWREVAQAAVRALDREIARGRTEDDARAIA